ncbi:MAG: PPOX class F420-dependent oxidoreductase [Acidimicrobiia bacterium]|nr:PPOX class F420-dependent oxidoreductase [Acidimicrobiia bacterium]
MNVSSALDWIAQRRNGVLITIRGDGRPQSSDIVYHVDDGAVVISVTDNRAKTRNLRRDPRAVLHVSEPSSWSYVSLDGTVDLTEVAGSPDDATADALADYYRAVAGQEHPDWAEYRQAMVDEGRLLVRLTPSSAVGQING